MKHVRGDLIAMALDGKFDVIVHGCNCFHTMGAGIALHIANTFDGEAGPRVVDKYATLRGDRDKLGSFSIARGTTSTGATFSIVNGYTQYGFGPDDDGNPPVDYDAIRDVFRGLARLCSSISNIRIGYPAIGAGLAGGDWNRI